jgi:hypothetical protein
LIDDFRLKVWADMNTQRLERRIRRLEYLLLGALLVLSGSWAFGSPLRRRQSFDTVDVHLLRVLDAQQRPRFLIGAPLPDPQVQGQVYERSRPVPGIMFLDTLGNETGGVGLFDDLDGGGFCFDHATAEAVCLTKANRFGFIGLTILDRPAPGSEVGQPGSERLQLAASRGTSQLVLSDAAGNERIRLVVASTGTAGIEILDEAGNPVARVPDGQ